MATQQRAAAIGVENIMSAYDLMSQNGAYPCFSVWYNSNDKSIQWNREDSEAGREYLKDYFELLNNAGDNSMYYIKIHTVANVVYNRKSDEVCSFPVRANPFHETEFRQVSGEQVSGIGNGSQIARMLNDLPTQLQEKFDLLNARIDQIEAPEVEEKDMFGKIAGLLDHPNVGPAIGGILQIALAKLMSLVGNMAPAAVPQNVAMTPAINGINDMESLTEDQKDEMVNQALDRLEAHCDLAGDLTLLANMAEKNPKMFEMLLSTLRAQK